MAKTPAAPSYPKNIPALVESAWTEFADRVVLEHRDDATGVWHTITGTEALEKVNAVAKGLIASGVKKGERVGIMSRTRLEWTLLDFGIQCAGGIPVPIYDTSSADQVDWITSDADIKVVFAETADNAETVRSIATGESPVSKIHVIDDGAVDHLIEAGVNVEEDTLAKRKSSAGPDDLATIIYTSGTTGRPKGTQLTHFNFTRHAVGVREELEPLWRDDPRTLQFMTLAHVFARIIQIACMGAGVTIGYTPDSRDLARDMPEFKPTMLVAVPRVFEKVYNNAEQTAAAGGKSAIFRWAVAKTIAYSRALDTDSGPSAGQKFAYTIADKLLLSKMRARMGGNVKWAVSGGAPLGERLGHFFRGVGITVLEGYGLTETTAASHVNRPGEVKIGTVGRPLQGVEVKIAKDGEILMRGDIVFKGYYGNDEATKAAIKDGWFHTGDVGEEDDDGYLKITGRKKELIVTAGGKNVAPAVLEDRIRSHPLVSQCVVVGDAKPFIAALVTLDGEALPGWLKAHGHDEMTVEQAAASEVVRAEIDTAVERANKAVSRAESIRKYSILTIDFTVMNGYLTPSIKVKRARVHQDFATEIEALYASAPAVKAKTK